MAAMAPRSRAGASVDQLERPLRARGGGMLRGMIGRPVTQHQRGAPHVGRLECGDGRTGRAEAFGGQRVGR
jgi:hypothetical protein